MAQDFTVKSTPQLDAIVTNANSHEGMLEALRRELGMRDANDLHRPMGAPVEGQPAAPVLPAAPPTHMRVIYPHLNDRMEIYGQSEADLDQQEKRIRELYA